jgi:hypothetical protein
MPRPLTSAGAVFTPFSGMPVRTNPVLASMLTAVALAGCVAAPTQTEPVSRLSLETCPAAVEPLDDAVLAANPKTLTDMIALGEQAEARLAYTQCQYRNTSRKDDYLVAVGQTLKADLLSYQQGVGRWQEANAKLNQHLSEYYGSCLGLHLNTDQYQACKEENDALDTERKRVNDTALPLQQQAQALDARNLKYSADINALMRESVGTGEAYTRAMRTHAHWLAQAYALMTSPELKPYTSEKGCPEIIAPPQDAATLLSLGADVIACFKKTAGAE